MHIVLHSQTDDLSPWVEGLRSLLPQVRFSIWPSEQTQDAEYALVWKPSQTFIDAHPNLKGIVNLGAGVDALLALNIPETIPIVRMVDAGMGVQMAEYAVFAVLQQYRRFKTYAQQQDAKLWQPLSVSPKTNYKIGVMGLGALGMHIVRALRYFDFPVLGWSATPKTIAGVQSFVGEAQLDTFLEQCQALVCILPLTAQTRHILNAHRLACLPNGAQVINVARGGLIDEDALLNWLDEDATRSAFLDVAQVEPLPLNSLMWKHPQISLTPHVAAITLRNAETMQDVANSILCFERGELPLGVVDRIRAY
jgi:glyoxylate/hydroxypyruvate reductase A